MLNMAVTLPAWLLLPLVLFAMLGLWLGLLAPLLRNYFYRRRERSLRKLDEQLEFGLSGYAQARRSQWLDRLLHDPVVTDTIEAVAAETGRPVEQVRQRARRDAGEIVPFFNALLYFRVGYWLARWFLRTMYRIRTRFSDRDSLGAIDRDNCVVLVSNHRSNLDPFLLIYLASKRTAISYSAGEWALVWPFRYLLHAIGFYIIRRDQSGDRLHQTLVQRYVFLAASHCVPQGLFLEGGLSRDGKMLPLKLGLLSYLLKARGHGTCRDIVFVPVGLSYDRIPEDRTLVAHQQAGFADKGRLYSLWSFLRFAVLIMPRMIGLTRPWGQVVANFGEPLALSQWRDADGRSLDPADDTVWRQQVTTLGERLRGDIQRLIPVLPVALLAEALLAAGEGGIAELPLKQRALQRGAELRAAGVAVELPEDGEDRAFSEALYALLKRRQVELGADERLRVAADGSAVLTYYRNAIPAGRQRD
jgi:glycerol-3-phosphate O-acyltransferase